MTMVAVTMAALRAWGGYFRGKNGQLGNHCCDFRCMECCEETRQPQWDKEEGRGSVFAFDGVAREHVSGR